MAVAEELRLEQTFRRAHRIGGIDDDHVEAAGFAFLHELHAVLEAQLRPLVAVGLAQLGEILFGKARHLLVDIDLHGAGHFAVAQHFPQGAAVAAADDQHVARCRVAEQRRVGHHLVVEKVIPGGEHGGAVNGHQIAEGIGVPHFDVLIVGLYRFQLSFQAQAEGGAGGVEMLDEPVVFFGAHKGVSAKRFTEGRYCKRSASM